MSFRITPSQRSQRVRPTRRHDRAVVGSDVTHGAEIQAIGIVETSSLCNSIRHAAVPSNSIRWTAILLIVLFAGCKVGPNYARPSVPTPPMWQGTEGHVLFASTAEGEETSWWQQLGSPELDRIVWQLENQNYSLLEAAHRIEEAQAQRRATTTQRFPTFGVDSSYSYRRFSQNGNAFVPQANSTSGFDFLKEGMDLSWEVDLWGRVKRLEEAAAADIDRSHEMYRDLRIMLIAEACRTFLEARVLQHRLLIADANRRLQADTLELARAREQAGLSSALDVHQAATQLNLTEATIPDLEAQLRASVHRLCILQGLPPVRDPWVVIGEGDIPSAPDELIASIPCDLLRQRPDVRAAEDQLRADSARIGVATADLYPQIRVNGTVSVESRTGSALFSQGSLAHDIGPSVKWSIFQLGRVKASIAASKARYEQSMAKYRMTVLEGYEEVENALVRLDTSRRSSDLLAMAVIEARQAYDLAVAEYQQGALAFQTVLDAERQLLAAQDEWARARGNAVQSFVELYRALGGSWTPAMQIAERDVEMLETDLTPNSSLPHDTLESEVLPAPDASTEFIPGIELPNIPEQPLSEPPVLDPMTPLIPLDDPSTDMSSNRSLPSGALPSGPVSSGPVSNGELSNGDLSNSMSVPYSLGSPYPIASPIEPGPTDDVPNESGRRALGAAELAIEAHEAPNPIPSPNPLLSPWATPLVSSQRTLQPETREDLATPQNNPLQQPLEFDALLNDQPESIERGTIQFVPWTPNKPEFAPPAPLNAEPQLNSVLQEPASDSVIHQRIVDQPERSVRIAPLPLETGFAPADCYQLPIGSGLRSVPSAVETPVISVPTETESNLSTNAAFRNLTDRVRANLIPDERHIDPPTLPIEAPLATIEANEPSLAPLAEHLFQNAQPLPMSMTTLTPSNLGSTPNPSTDFPASFSDAPRRTTIWERDLSQFPEASPLPPNNKNAINEQGIIRSAPRMPAGRIPSRPQTPDLTSPTPPATANESTEVSTPPENFSETPVAESIKPLRVPYGATPRLQPATSSPSADAESDRGIIRPAIGPLQQ